MSEFVLIPSKDFARTTTPTITPINNENTIPERSNIGKLYKDVNVSSEILKSDHLSPESILNFYKLLESKFNKKEVVEKTNESNIFDDLIKIIPKTQHENGYKILEIIKNVYSINERGYIRNNIYLGDVLKALLTTQKTSTYTDEFIKEIKSLIPNSLIINSKYHSSVSPKTIVVKTPPINSIKPRTLVSIADRKPNISRLQKDESKKSRGGGITNHKLKWSFI